MNLQKRELLEKIVEENLHQRGQLRLSSFRPGTFREVLNLKSLTLPNLRHAALELIVAKRLAHENIFSARDIQLDSQAHCAEMALNYDAGLVGLDRLIAAGCLSTRHLKFIMYQLFSLVNYLHFNGLVARNICPSNLMISDSTHVLFGDFSALRLERFDNKGLLEHRLDINYSAPELSLNLNRNFFASDVWSLGCLLFEMVERRPLFRVNHSLDLLRSILRCLGSPVDNRQLNFVSSKGTIKWIKSQTHSEPKSVTRWMKNLGPNPHLSDLIDKCLRLDPAERITAAEALGHPFFAELYDAEEEKQSLRNHLAPADLATLFAHGAKRQSVLSLLRREVEA